MEVLYSLVAVLSASFLVILSWRILNWAWFKPKKREKCLRQQGLRGNSYNLVFGDMKETVRMIQEAKSKPINFTNDIVSRVMPFIDKTIKTYGMFYLQIQLFKVYTHFICVFFALNYVLFIIQVLIGYN